MKNIFTFFLFIISFSIFAQEPANDDCIDAIELTGLSLNCNFYQFNEATYDFMGPSCGVDSMRNIWFKFTAEEKALKIESFLMDGSKAHIQVFYFQETSCDSTGAVRIACGVGKLERNNLLHAGEEYYFSISVMPGASTSQVMMCLTNSHTNQGAPNDELCYAIAVSIDSSCIDGTLLNSTYDTNNPACTNPDERSVWYSGVVPQGVKAVEVDFTPLSLGSSEYGIGVYKLLPGQDCHEKATYITGFCGAGRNKFNVYGLTPGERYYFMISSLEGTGNTFALCLNPVISPPGCAENEFCEMAEEIELRVDNSFYCFTGCNIGAAVGPIDTSKYCAEFYNPSVYYKLPVDSFMHLLNINISSDDFVIPQLAVFYGDCEGLNYVICDFGNNGELSLSFRPTVFDVDYYLVVSDVAGFTGSFDLCVEARHDDFHCGSESTLEVLYASLGSPLEGPYRAGEELHFRYTIPSWHPTKCNWLQGIVPYFVTGWDRKSFNNDGELKIRVKDPEPHSAGTWDWYNMGNVHFNLDNPVKRYGKDEVMPGGWFFLEEGAESIDSSGGDGLVCSDSLDMEWIVEFKVRISSYPQCVADTIYNAILEIISYSDGEIGNREMAACLTDLSTYFSVPFVCCPGPEMAIFTDTICSGETINLAFEEVDTISEYRWSVFAGDYVTGSAAGIGNSINQTLVNDSYEPQIVEYTLYAQDTMGCYGPPGAYRVTVLPRLDVNAGSEEFAICRGHDIELGGDPTVRGGLPPYSYRWSNSELQGANPLHTATNSTQFFLQVMDANNCLGYDTASIVVSDPPKAIMPDFLEVCAGDSVILEVELTGTAPFVFNPMIHDEHIGWDTSSVQNRSYTIKGDSSTVFVIDSLSDAVCGTESINATEIIVRDSTLIYYDAFICGDEVMSMGGKIFDETGIYEVFLPGANQYGCDSIIILDLKVNELIRLRDTIMFYDEENDIGNLGVKIQGGTPPYRYLWSTGARSERIIRVPSGIYSVTVTDAMDCQREFEFFLGDEKSSSVNLAEPIYSLYPQPVESGGEITLSLKNLEHGRYTFDMYSVTGEKVISERYQHTSSSAVLRQKMEKSGLYYWHLIKNGQIVLAGKCIVI